MSSTFNGTWFLTRGDEFTPASLYGPVAWIQYLQRIEKSDNQWSNRICCRFFSVTGIDAMEPSILPNAPSANDLITPKGIET